MTYIEGFVIPVPTANRDKFIEHARTTDEMFMKNGALRVVEGWQADVSRGKVTDFFGAVDAREDESVAFAWIEWANKAARESGMAAVNALFETDPRWNAENNPVPFDGGRMIYGGFQPIVEEGARQRGGYIQGFIVPVPEAKKEAYRKMAQDAWPFFRKHGARRLVEGWPDDVPHGRQTDFYRAVKTEPGEIALFSFIEWESRDACDEAAEAMQNDPEMTMPDEMPFDGMRMIFGGFAPVVELGA
jgi:uncharacterized protein YbaA (DUF1428 family)